MDDLVGKWSGEVVDDDWNDAPGDYGLGGSQKYEGRLCSGQR